MVSVDEGMCHLGQLPTGSSSLINRSSAISDFPRMFSEGSELLRKTVRVFCAGRGDASMEGSGHKCFEGHFRALL